MNSSRREHLGDHELNDQQCSACYPELITGPSKDFRDITVHYCYGCRRQLLTVGFRCEMFSPSAESLLEQREIAPDKVNKYGDAINMAPLVAVLIHDNFRHLQQYAGFTRSICDHPPRMRVECMFFTTVE